MKHNPVYKREVTVRGRSFRLPLIVMVFNGILAAVTMLNMYSVVAQVRISAAIQYSSFLQLFAFVCTLEFLLLMFIMPALTSGSISGERERQTLELLFTTKMTPGQIIKGKLFSAFSQLLILVVSSFPVILTTFVYGGVDFRDLALLLLCYVTVAMYAGGIGILASSFMRRSTFSNVCTYGVLLLTVAGTYMINLFTCRMSEMQISGYVKQMGEVMPKPDSGPAIYLLLINPVVTFIQILGKQVPSPANAISLSRFLGNRPENFVIANWVPVSLCVQLVLAAILIKAAVYFLNPVRNEKNSGRRK